MAKKIALLTQFLKTELLECQQKFFGHAEDMLHVSLLLLDFVMKGRFSNIGPDSACPAGGFPGWTSPQGIASDRGATMAATEADAVPRDSRLSTSNHIAQSSKVVLEMLVDGRRARLETGMVAYFLWRLFVAKCPFIEELTGLLSWSETNQVTFHGQVKKSHNETAFVADVSRILGQFLNSCVVASTTAGLLCPWLLYPGVPGPALTGTFLVSLPRVRLPYDGVEYSLAPIRRVPPRCWHSHARRP